MAAAALIDVGQESPLDAAKRRARELLRPPPNLTLSQWADRYYYMSPEHGGKWKTFPYQRAVMDALSDPEIERVSVKKSARVGYTHMIMAFLLRNVHQNPVSQLFVLPTVDDAEDFSKGDVGPALDRHTFLRGIVADSKSRDSNNTIKAKRYHGRTMWFIGANSGSGFRRVHAPVVLADEIDEFPASAGKTKSHGGQGDPIELAWRRTQEEKVFRKLVQGSTPIDKGASRIDRAYDESDQRLLYVPCPHCDEWQPLEWGGKDHDLGFKFDTSSERAAFDSVQYLCRKCHCFIDERSKLPMLELADSHDGWKAHAPSVQNHAGFFLWSAYSLSPNATWGHIASEFVRLKGDPVNLKTFVNTWLGQAWEQRGRAPSEERLLDRREPYPVRDTRRRTDGGEAETELMVPHGGVVLTSMTDVQLDRLEVGIEAWGRGEENWKLEYHVLHGDPTAEPVWQALFELLLRARHLARGGVDYVRSSCIDSGYATQSVYAFVRSKAGGLYKTADGRVAYLWATKGVTGTGNVWPSTPSKNSTARVPIWPIKVDAAKDIIYGRLERTPRPGPAYIHFPRCAPFEKDYFRQLTAEHSIDDRDAKGFPVRVWRMKDGQKRNEALDIAVGNYAALQALYPRGLDLDAEADRAGVPPTPEFDVPVEVEGAEPQAMRMPPPPAAPRRRSRRRWTEASL